MQSADFKKSILNTSCIPHDKSYFMSKMRKAFRLFFFTLFLFLAAIGMGFSGVLFPNHREKYLDNEIRIEQTQKKEDEDAEKENDTKE